MNPWFSFPHAFLHIEKPRKDHVNDDTCKIILLHLIPSWFFSIHVRLRINVLFLLFCCCSSVHKPIESWHSSRPIPKLWICEKAISTHRKIYFRYTRKILRKMERHALDYSVLSSYFLLGVNGLNKELQQLDKTIMSSVVHNVFTFPNIILFINRNLDVSMPPLAQPYG